MNLKTKSAWAGIFAWAFPLVLIVPNIVLDITEFSSPWVKALNVLLPGGLYLWCMSGWKNVGRTSVLLLPVLFYGAFQIVLLFLYGGSIIAVDMFLNVATTNVHEASELLGNLAPAMLVVCLVYVPALIAGIVLWCTKAYPGQRLRRGMRTAGLSAVFAGIACCVGCYVFVPGFNLVSEVFPANVVQNTVEAVDRMHRTGMYPATSASFAFDAHSAVPDSVPQIYVMVVGETSRAANWQLAGYPRPTNPRLARRDDIVFYPKAVSQSNTTHKSVPLMLSCLSAGEFGDSIYYVKSVIEAFNEAGFYTAYLSNQGRNHSFIDFFAQEADTTVFLHDDGLPHLDSDLLELLQGTLAARGNKKLFAVLHTYGSHFNYLDRFDHSEAPFTPYDIPLAEARNRAELINAYDNTIVYTDSVVDHVIAAVDSLGCRGAVLYTSDHGEDIYDDARHRFLHASPVPTYYQLHVPLLMWMSPELIDQAPDKIDNARAHTDMYVATSAIVFDTLLDLADITTNHTDRSQALTAPGYTPSARLYVNDHNRGVALKESGLRKYDFEEFDRHGIDIQ